MPFQAVFKRYELKYILTLEQKNKLLNIFKDRMERDKYGISTIRNLYYDTDTYLLVRRSIEKPIYKEKLRIRSYDKATNESTVFVELKKKYNGVVYKRRIALTNEKATAWMSGVTHPKVHTQISDEIDYFLSFYGNLEPKVVLSYEREAYYSNDASNFRVTFDQNILCRQTDLSLESDVYGTPILPQDKILMEIKCDGGIPLWMTDFLSKERIYKTPFSKYGTAYKILIFSKKHSVNKYNMLEVT